MNYSKMASVYHQLEYSIMPLQWIKAVFIIGCMQGKVSQELIKNENNSLLMIRACYGK